MEKRTDIEGRDPFTQKNSIYNTGPSLGRTLLFLIPAFLYLCSCTLSDPHYSPREDFQARQQALHTKGSMKDLHIFTYNEDSLMRLDAYQNYSTDGSGRTGIDSRTGRKRVVFCGNSHYSTYHWHDIQSYARLGEIGFNIENEDPAFPLSSCEASITAGSDRPEKDMTLIPYLAEIVLESLKVDFSTTSYAGSALTDIRVYLTNVNAEVSLTQKDFNSSKRWVNSRRLIPEELKDFKHPEMLSKHLHDISDRTAIFPAMSLFCFPNTCREEDLGNAFTKLVIEGKINGQTWYYPIPINRESSNPVTGSGKGVERNSRYTYDIVIRRSGSDSPDHPVEFGSIETRLNIEPWTVKKEYDIAF